MSMDAEQAKALFHKYAECPRESIDWGVEQRRAAFAAIDAMQADIDRLRKALLDCARKAEALKRDCGMSPESPQAVRNAQYQDISTTAHIALGTFPLLSSAALSEEAKGTT
jgi:hypothetical protein